MRLALGVQGVVLYYNTNFAEISNRGTVRDTSSCSAGPSRRGNSKPTDPFVGIPVVECDLLCNCAGSNQSDDGL